MGGIASERHASEGPGFDRVLVNHRIFQDQLGVADHLRRVQPVETPAFIERQKVRQVTRFIPVVLLEGIALDVGHPVDELVALPIDVIDNWVDDHLAGQYRAGAYKGTAVEDWLSPRHPAPAVDAGKGQLVVRVILFADRRIDAVASDHCVCPHALAHAPTRGLLEMHGGAGLVLLDTDAFMIGANGIGPDLIAYCFSEYHVEPAAMNSDFGNIVAGELASRLLVDQLSEAVEEGAFAILNAGGQQGIA